VPRTPGRVVQERGVGLVPARSLDTETGDETALAFAVPQLIRSDPVADADAVLVLEPDITPRAGEQSIGVGAVFEGPENDSADAAIEVPAFFNDAGGPLWEDPVTGILNASVAKWLIGSGRVEAPYVGRQGARVSRDGRVQMTEADGELWIGGTAVVPVSGVVWAYESECRSPEQGIVDLDEVGMPPLRWSQ